MAPFFIYSNPAMARNLLSFRHATLPAARERAAEMGQKRGAAFPWRTIAGRECSAYYPSGSAQYHINADIAYAYMSYYEATDDFDFMAECGAEVLFETARTWLDIGHYADGTFRIESVTGPDEYTCLVDNNFYTNAMARHNLRGACRLFRELRDRAPDRLRELRAELKLADDEVVAWERAAFDMYLPYDAARDLTPQDDGFLSKEVWDFEGTPKDNYPLLLHYHHLAIIRRQVCKQADAVLAHLLLPDLVAESTKRKSFDYYERITTHDSSLSYSVFASMAARLGDAEKAYKYLLETVRLDLDDSHGNSKDGVHAAAMGGTWLALIFGFGGFKAFSGEISLDPVLPASWNALSFTVRYRGRTIRVRVGRETVRIDLLSGKAIELTVRGRPALLDTRGLLVGSEGERLSP
jgi:alpha,alpha-trehalose phosphorylase